MQEFPGGITNGNAWYTVHGSMQDYNYIMGNCMDLTLELNVKKHPDASELAALWIQNKDAFLDFAIAATFQGFRLLLKTTLSDEDKCFLEALFSTRIKSHYLQPSQ